MPDETPIVGVEGSTEPPIVSPSPSTDLDHRRKNRFGSESRKGALGLQPRQNLGMQPRQEQDQEISGSQMEPSADQEQSQQDSPKAENVITDVATNEQAQHFERKLRRHEALLGVPKRTFGVESDNLSSSTLLTSMPHTAKVSLLAVRKWQQVPDETTDDALLSGIDPNMIALIMQIIQQIMACIPNNKNSGWSRVVNYSNARGMERLGDNMRLNAMINRWAGALAVPRESGDVVMIREAITQAGASLKMEEFVQVQSEASFLTI